MKLLGCNPGPAGEVCHLSQGMHPGIRTSRADQDDFLTGHGIQSRFNLALDRSVPGLSLPSMEVRTVIFNGEFEIVFHSEALFLWLGCLGRHTTGAPPVVSGQFCAMKGAQQRFQCFVHLVQKILWTICLVARPAIPANVPSAGPKNQFAVALGALQYMSADIHRYLYKGFCACFPNEKIHGWQLKTKIDIYIVLAHLYNFSAHPQLAFCGPYRRFHDFETLYVGPLRFGFQNRCGSDEDPKGLLRDQNRNLPLLDGHGCVGARGIFVSYAF